MRFELALVVGIVFFCCWCAFIIIRMNSSLSQQQQAEPSPATTQINSSSKLYRSNSNSNNNNNNNGIETAPEENQLRDHYYYHESQSQPSPVRYENQQQPKRPQAHYPASSISGQAVLANFEHPAVGRQAGYRRGQLVKAAARRGSGQVEQPPGKDQTGEHATQPGESEDEEGGGESDSSDQEDEQEQEQEHEQDQDQDLPGTKRDSEEIEAGRSFSQNEDDASERDRFGNPIRAYSRHLINGRPVRRPVAVDFDKVVDEIEADGQAQEDDEQQAAKVASEYGDQANRATDREQHQQQQQPEESRLSAISSGLGGRQKYRLRAQAGKRSSSSKPSEKRRPDENFGSSQLEEIDEHSKDNLLPPNAKDSHQHRTKESLRAQQWDDDAATPTNPTRDDNQPLETSSNVAQEEAANNSNNAEDLDRSGIVFEDLDLLSDGRFPFIEISAGNQELQQQPSGQDEEDEEPEQKRSKRSCLGELIRLGRSIRAAAGVGPDESSQLITDNGGQREQLMALEPDKGGPTKNNSEDGEKSAASDNDDELPHPVATKNQHQRPSANSDRLADNRKSQEPSAVGRIDRPNAATAGMTNDDIDTVGEEDLSIEVLADPPTSENRRPFDATTTTVPANQAPNSSILTWPPSNGHSAGPHNELQPIEFTAGAAASGAPQVGQFDAAQGRQVASDSKPKGEKKKKKAAHVKKSKAHHSKYNAAKVASMKRKSKLKKGGLAEKKTKRGKKYAKSYKEFKGSTRGKKGAKGVGQRGGKKGALYYKDKGYKKRGFKKAYQKVESGDHKTYFDEFRDKDHSKKWKDFKDKHHYSHGKKWAANDRKKYKNMSAKELRDKKYGLGKWREKEQSKFRKDYGKKSRSKSMERSKKSRAKKSH